MTTVDHWRAFLQRWSDEYLKTDERFPPAVRRSRWLGYKRATEQQIGRVEKRLGYRLPPSYRAFLLTTNGWRQTCAMVGGVRPVGKIEWLAVDDPPLVEIWSELDGGEPYAGVPRDEYFAYDGRPFFDGGHFRGSLKIADPAPGDSALYVLNPAVVTADGEWEAWEHASWIPGAHRYPTFAHLMRQAYETFRKVDVGDEMSRGLSGPYTGVYAPDQPRHAAERVGRVRPRSRRQTVAELVGQLGSPSPRLRLDAVKKLPAGPWQRDASGRSAELVATLVRVLTTDDDADVRCVAATTVGTVGDETAYAPLLTILGKVDVAPAEATSAADALANLTLTYPRPKGFVDVLVTYLSVPRDPTSASATFQLLEDADDPRLAEVARRLLDGDVDAQLRFQAAFALAASSPTADVELTRRMADLRHEVRAAAAAAVRQARSSDDRTLVALRLLEDDPDQAVRKQATTSLRMMAGKRGPPADDQT